MGRTFAIPECYIVDCGVGKTSWAVSHRRGIFNPARNTVEASRSRLCRTVHPEPSPLFRSARRRASADFATKGRTLVAGAFVLPDLFTAKAASNGGPAYWMNDPLIV
jgi:hypothetical protein